MLPGNWATDLDGGSSKIGYTLLIVVLLANFVTMFLQGLCLKLGERDLAQACRCAVCSGSDSFFLQYISEHDSIRSLANSHDPCWLLISDWYGCRDAYPVWVIFPSWVLPEVAIVATDLVEVVGPATALYLLFNIPLWGGVLITVADVPSRFWAQKYSLSRADCVLALCRHLWHICL